jgi:uncharacterized protein (DUF2236 family)
MDDAGSGRRCDDGRMPRVSLAVEQFSADGVLIVGGAVAILLQVADPAVAAGVARHSGFAERPVERLRNTLTFAYAVGFGTEDDAARVTRHVNRAHIPVARAEDAQLQLWVAATLFQTARAVHEIVYGPSPIEDELLAAYAPAGTALQMPLELWPTSIAAFDDYWNARLEALDVTDDARQIAHDLFHPTIAPRWVRAALPLAELLTVDLLPPRIRRAYGFRLGPVRRCQARWAWRIIRLVARALPARAKSWPARRLLRDLRR